MAKFSSAQTNFNGGEISPLLYGRPDVDRYQTGLATCENFVPLLQGPLERRPGTHYIDSTKVGATEKARLIGFEFSAEQSYALEFGDLYVRFIKDRAQIVSGTPVEVVTPYLEADLFSLKTAQSADVMYIAHKSYAPRTLSRTSDTSWTLATIDFEDGPYLNTNTTATTIGLSGATGSVTVTASTAIFASTDVDRLIRWKDPATNWTWLKITAFTSTTVVTATIMGADASATTATVDWRLGVWSETTGYPSTVTFHQSRLCWGGGVDYPQRVDMSRSGDFLNMTPTDPDGLVVDDHAVAITLSASGVNEIVWLEDDEKGLICGTGGAEWNLRPSSQGEAITPSNIQAKQSSSYGSADVTPMRVGKSILFIQRSGLKLRDLAYVFEDDGFRAPDMTLISEHITEGGITEIAYQSEPQSVVWGVRGDGTLLGLSFDRSQNITGWHRHIVGGVSDALGNPAIVESVCSIPNPTGNADDLLMVVQRYVNGAVVRHMEYLSPFWRSTNDQEDAVFLDSALTYDGAAATVISGLGHLEGETVDILADGAVRAPQAVASGAITLSSSASVVHVGLGYTSNMYTLRNAMGAKDGTAQAKTKRLHRVNIQVHSTLGGSVGPDADNLDPIILREGGDPMDTAVPLYTGYVEIEWDGQYDKDAQVYYRQSQPLPTTIVAILPHGNTQDR